MDSLHVAEAPVKPTSVSVTCTCTCPDGIQSTGDLCRSCLEEYRAWRWDCDQDQPDPEPESEEDEGDAFPGHYPDEAMELPESDYGAPSNVTIEVHAKEGWWWVDMRMGSDLAWPWCFPTKAEADAWARSLFGCGGEAGDDDPDTDPFLSQTMTPFEFNRDFLDPTEDDERDEALARTQMEWDR